MILYKGKISESLTWCFLSSASEESKETKLTNAVETSPRPGGT